MPPIIWLLSAGLLCVGAGQSLVFITIPPLARDLGLTEIQIGFIFAASAAAWIILSPYWGALSDRIGRKRVVIIGLLGFAISLYLFSFTISLGQLQKISGWLLFFLLIVTRLINGILGSATRPASGGWIADITNSEERSRAFARLDSGFSAGRIIGPALAGFLLLISYTTPFYVFSLFAVLVSIIIFQQEAPRRTSTDKGDKKSLSILDAKVWPFLLVSAAFGVCNAAIVQTSSFFFQDIIVPASGIKIFGLNISNPITFSSLGFMLTAVGVLTGQLLFADKFRIPPGSLILYGSSILCISLVGIVVSYSLLSIYLPLYIYGVGTGMLGPGVSASLSLSVEKDNQGSASGFLGMVIPIGHIISPLVTMPLYSKIAPQAPYILGFFVMLGIFIFVNLNSQHRWIRNKSYGKSIQRQIIDNQENT